MPRFEQQMKFIIEIDKLKSVMRRSMLIDGSRFENSAEHSWHFSLMALTLSEYYPHQSLNIAHVIKMALVHDIAEIDAGDTYCYDERSCEDQHERELKAAKRIFSLLPKDLEEEFFALWQEFELNESHEAKFANAIDRLNPFMLNFFSGGLSWKKHGVKKSQALKRMGEIRETAPKLWEYIEKLLNNAVEAGYIIDDTK